MLIWYSPISDSQDNPSTGAAEVGTSKITRRLFRSNMFTIDFEVVRIDVDCDIKDGEDITLRVYQEGKEANADSILITDSDTVFTADADVQIKQVYGARNLIVDLWDPTTPTGENDGSFEGLVTIYGRPLTIS